MYHEPVKLKWFSIPVIKISICIQRLCGYYGRKNGVVFMIWNDRKKKLIYSNSSWYERAIKRFNKN